jgi:hypothetical protein
MKAWGLTELVLVSKLGHGDWPEEFTWRGRRRKVRRIEAYESPQRSGTSGSAGGERHFRLKTEDGLSCVLAHDIRRDRWAVKRLYANSGGG